jgi:glycerophosphoryl diester phosphodiesterase
LRLDAKGGSAAEHAARRADGGWSVRARGPEAGPLEVGAPRRLRLMASGGRVRLWVDEGLALDSALARDAGPGALGLGLSSGRIAFDGFRLRRLSADEVSRLRVDYGPLRRILVIAHRGASSIAPENTLAALRLAIEHGAQGAEFDVHRTRDGALIVMHDEDLLRTTDFKKAFPGRERAEVALVDLQDLLQLDAGSWKSPAYRGEPVPTLEQALDLLRGKTTAVVEIKPEGIGRDVARAIRKAGMAEQVFVQSFSARAVREFHEELPQAATGFLTDDRVSASEAERARSHLRQAREVGASAVVCDHALVGPAYLEEIHRHAMAVWVYTVDDPALAEMLVRLGVDGIITNVPKPLLELLEAARAGR